MRFLRYFFVCMLLMCPTLTYAEVSNLNILTKQIKNAYSASEYAEVIGLCDKAIELVSQSKKPNPLTLTRFLDYKAMSMRMLGNYKGAEACYWEEISMLDEFPSRLDNAKCKLGVLYTEMGLFTKANDVLCSVKDRKQMGWSTLHRASLSMRQGQREDALSLLNQIFENYGENDDLMLSAHQNYGFMLTDSKDMDQKTEALSHLEYALDHLDSDKLPFQTTLANKAILEARMNQFETALVDINHTIDWYEKSDNTSLVDYKIAIRKKAEILVMMGSLQEAADVYKNYFDREKHFALGTFYSMTEQNRLDFWKTLKPNVSRIFALEGYCPDFLLDVALFRREVALLSDADKEDIDKRLSINADQVRNALKKHEIAIDFVRYLKNDTARYGAIIVPPKSMRNSVKFIPLWTEEELHGYMIDECARLDDALCEDDMDDKDILYSNSKLSHYIWDKLNSELNKYDYEKVYFAPDGLLHLLAIEYMREDDGSCLHRVTSLSKLLDRKRHKISFKSKMLAAGGLDYDNVDSIQISPDTHANHDAMDLLKQKLVDLERPFIPLKGAKIEIDSIGSFSPFVTDTSTIQTEQRLKNIIINKDYNILHLSTHGYALDIDVPVVPEAFCDSITEDRSLLTTGIALTSANVAHYFDGAEDGILSAREFCEMDMRNIDLMVLSACQTGLGRFNDEGPAGLVRGLKKAGAGSLIVSLWTVDDKATMLFMKHLYQGISEQRSPDLHTAFHAARRNLAKETEDSYYLPRFCNAFILIDAIK